MQWMVSLVDICIVALFLLATMALYRTVRLCIQMRQRDVVIHAATNTLQVRSPVASLQPSSMPEVITTSSGSDVSTVSSRCLVDSLQSSSMPEVIRTSSGCDVSTVSSRPSQIHEIHHPQGDYNKQWL
jgi:hypothetical protein